MGALSPLVMMGLMFVVFYFLLIRPQVKKQKEHQAMLSKLGKGEQVITRGGIIGTITGSQGNDVVVLEIQEKVRVRVPRAYIENKWTEAKGEAKADKAA
ncbi:MAG: preprotein translocase subunit YajC [Kofleriaceae bacterium]|nr:preprotein translocase subunit YajC [Kofleriaceae bacterium]MCL4225022.1 preprotein translocase subunit YajC [Myxococcales bacterium]